MFSFFWMFVLWVKEAVIGFFRNFGWNVAALFLSIFCLLGFAVSFVAGESAEHLASELSKKVEVSVDLLSSIPKSEHKSIVDKIQDLPEVSEIRYVSEEEAYQKVKEGMGKDADILEVLDENPFTARVIIKMQEPKDVEKVAHEIESWGVSEYVQYGEGYVEKILSVANTISKVGYIVTVVVGLATIYIVSSVIKFNINQRKDEIRVKQLTGTGIFTIRIPFLLEALMITLLSSLIVYGVFYFGYGDVVETIKTTAPYIPMIEADTVIQGITKWIFVLAGGIGIVGSLLSTSRNLEKI